MTRRVTVRIPLLPVVAPAADAAPEPAPTFGPIGWEWASQGDDGDEAAVFVPPLELLHVRAFNTAVATCPGAIAWRIDPEFGPGAGYKLYQLTGAAVLEAIDNDNASDLYAISATGAELGPIVIETVA